MRVIHGVCMWSRACPKPPPCLSPFGFVFAEATVPRLSCCKGEVGIVPSLRPAEIWGEDEVSLKRRHITGSHVAHVTEACGSGSYVRVSPQKLLQSAACRRFAAARRRAGSARAMGGGRREATVKFDMWPTLDFVLGLWTFRGLWMWSLFFQ